MKKSLITIAGFDPSAGAGILLDLKVFAAFGFHGAAVLTAVTIQDTRRVRDVVPLPARLVKDQFSTLARDIDIAGIKVGMAGSGENLAAIAEILGAARGIPKVVDPVFRSSSGARLLDAAAVPGFLAEIRGKASVITPNLEEARRLTGRRVSDVAGMKRAAEEIYALGRIPCLIKGGHLGGDPVDLLYDGKAFVLFGRPRIRKDMHGTGCLLSAAILASLAKGKPLVRACEQAAGFVEKAIRKSARVGRGKPVFS
jgi:hydroxymethylpyrimidine kinase/phosphomethylpyrimidine kinase